MSEQIYFPTPLTAEQVAETLFHNASHTKKRMPLYGAFDGDVLVHWSTGRAAARRWAEARDLTFQRIA